MRHRSTPRQRLRRTALVALIAALPALFLVMFNGGGAQAHGAPMFPGSRTYLCWKYSQNASGAIDPTNPACQAALDQGGSSAFYNWFAVLRSDGGGRTEGFVPDGELCSGGATVYDFSGFDLPRGDWPYTHLTAGANYEINYNPWAHHPGTFRMYVTEDGWNPNAPLTWDDIEDTPFHEETDPPYRGSVGSADSAYYWDARMPSDKSGRHIIYMVWDRSDSQETFYSCSDVVFDGGNGEVTVPGDDGAGTAGGTTDGGTTDGGTTDGGETDGSTTDGGTTDGGETEGSTGGTVEGNCMASTEIVNSWGGGYQAEVTVTNHATAAISGWSVSWEQPSGNAIQSLWSGAHTASGDQVTVTNESWNGQLAMHASTTFGYTSSGSPPEDGPLMSCAIR